MHRLGIKDDEFDDVICAKEDPPSAEATRWLAIHTLHMEKKYNEFWFFKNMRITWDLMHEVKSDRLVHSFHYLIFLPR